MPASRLLAVDVAVEFVAAALRAGALAVAFLCALRVSAVNLLVVNF
jgi:hypothetical protein